MKTAMSGLLIALLAATVSSPAAAGPRDHGINARQHNQQHRIQQGWRQGDLTRGEAHRLQREARDIRREERAFRSDGRFTPQERREAHRDLNRLSRDIYRERHDAQRRFPERAQPPHFDRRPHYAGRHGEFTPWRGRPIWNGYHDRRFGYRGHFAPRNWDPRIDRIQRWQHDRIVAGIRSGALTRDEAHALRGEQRAIRAQERLYRSDGVFIPAERRDLYEDLYAASRHIYNETHDAETRR